MLLLTNEYTHLISLVYYSCALVKSSGVPLSEGVTLKAREYAHKNKILRGRHIIWMMIDYFKTNRSLQEQ